MKTAASVKAKLKYRAQRDGRNVQDVFIAYVLERVLYRISVSPYTENFTIKGGILLYGLFDEKYARTTTDIDLLGNRISNDSAFIKQVFKEILSIECDDAITFDLNTLTTKNITEFKEYHGVKVSLMAFLERTRIPVNIDIGFGDVIYPDKQKMEYPTVLDDDPPRLFAYSLESIVAEKFEAIVSLGVANSRYKDFYDIYMLSGRFDFDGKDLAAAIAETFAYRKTGLTTIVAFEEGFADDPYRKGRWKGFIKSKHADIDLSLEEVLAYDRSFLSPIVETIQHGSAPDMHWDHVTRRWIMQPSITTNM